MVRSHPTNRNEHKDISYVSRSNNCFLSADYIYSHVHYPRVSFLPSHIHIFTRKPFIYWGSGTLGGNECPSHYPHILGPFHSQREGPKVKTLGRRYPEAFLPNAPQPFVHRHFRRKCEYVRDIFEFSFWGTNTRSRCLHESD